MSSPGAPFQTQPRPTAPSDFAAASRTCQSPSIKPAASRRQDAVVGPGMSQILEGHPSLSRVTPRERAELDAHQRPIDAGVLEAVHPG